jgi:uncharacterized membrane protein
VLSYSFRWVHVLAGIVWVGLVFFVNFVQLVAMYEVDDKERAFIGKVIGARVAWWFRQASHLSVLTGLGLLVLTGYLLPSIFYSDIGMFAPIARVVVIWTGAIGGFIMWAFVHMVIWPNLQIMSGARPGDAEAKARARIKVRNYARANLILSVPVIAAMLASGHF